MNQKAEKFSQAIAENQITCFRVEEMPDEVHSVLYHTNVEVQGQNLPMVIVLDDSIYTMLAVQISGGGINEGNRQAVMERINTLNQKYKICKYFINDNHVLMFNMCIPQTAEEFNYALFKEFIDLCIRHLTEEYPGIMKAIWQG